jgi:gliding motility-associated-like protein
VSHFKKIIFLFLLAATYSRAQPYAFTLTKTIAQCENATAQLAFTGQQPADSVSIIWSTGATHTLVQSELGGGDYSVNVKIRHKKDTVINTRDTIIVSLKDTTIYFNVVKEECLVVFEKYFSPNGDNYNDVLGIDNIGKYPDFELDIFNKWGQRVHHQQSKYIPWDGKWLGIDLPDGAYYYVFFYDSSNHKHLVKGDITILR